MLPENQAEIIRKVTEERNLENKGYRIAEVVWLKRQDKPLDYTATLGIWFNTIEAAEWATRYGLIAEQRYIGIIETYHIKNRHRYQCLGAEISYVTWVCRD